MQFFTHIQSYPNHWSVGTLYCTNIKSLWKGHTALFATWVKDLHQILMETHPSPYFTLGSYLYKK